MTRVLVVESDPQLVRALRINLQARKFQALEAVTGTDALELAAACPPDAILLDLGLPDIDGVEVIRSIRAWSTVPILVLSARRTSQERARALDAGANDYVAKPFSMDELLARLRAATRRETTSGPADRPMLVITEDFTIDLAEKTVRREQGEVRLTPTEWHLLEVLVHHTGAPVSRRQLLLEVWGPAYADNTTYLRVYMAKLRRKLEPNPSHPRHLLTQPGMGYRFEP
ncbi:response regulator transcription factor (plasmid) [Streptomyces erythrochromogenes]|uniref:Response regulator transcription factor n=1 Tax=Streptomyces erythrochromogenes TaxID=285574 RepID=A0ABZ1QPU2_9ACTN|nr:response regulator transcription factor [Streptomyces erythrochromogenes]